MGFDLIGLAPRSEQGEYFRNNAWYWRPLWAYCSGQHPDLLPPNPERGQFNDGFEVPEDLADALSAALFADLEDGTVKRAIESFRVEQAALPQIRCQWCEGSGIRTDDIGQQRGFPTMELPEVEAISLGRTHGTCNVCRGLGWNLPPLADYDFDADNVRRFAEFARESGGFDIW